MTINQGKSMGRHSPIRTIQKPVKNIELCEINRNTYVGRFSVNAYPYFYEMSFDLKGVTNDMAFLQMATATAHMGRG